LRLVKVHYTAFNNYFCFNPITRNLAFATCISNSLSIYTTDGFNPITRNLAFATSPMSPKNV